MQRAIPLHILGVVLALAPRACADDDDALVPSITVVGEGEVQVEPNMATVTVGVTTQAKTAADAVKQNSELMTKLLAALKDHDISDKHVQTANFNVTPRQTYDRTGRTPPKIDGYTVTNQVSVKVLELSRLGAILDASVSAGSNQIQGISFSLADPGPHMEQARRKAIRDARARAQTYAEEAKVRVGEPLVISEQGGVSPPQPYPMMRGEAMAAASVPVAPGEQTLSARVTVTYSIAEGE